LANDREDEKAIYSPFLMAANFERDHE